MFVLASNQFWKCFSVNADVWLRMENRFSRKEFQLTVKLRPLTRKIFSTNILPSNHFWRRTKRERERERTHTCKHRERERERERERSWTQKTQDRWTQKIRDRRTANPRTTSHTTPIAPVSRTVPITPQFDQIWWFFFFCFVSFVSWTEKWYYIFVWKMRKCEKIWATSRKCIFYSIFKNTAKY